VAGALSQTDLAATANMGVVGFGGDGPKPVGTSDFVGPTSAGAGVRGVGGVVTDATGTVSFGGPGVVGLAGGAADPGDGPLMDIGVAGAATIGPGAAGSSTSGPGVLGTSTSGPGVRGDSGSTVGGFFTSRVLAQLHLDPHRRQLANPNGTIAGSLGDLLVLQQRRQLDRQNQLIGTLWFCRISGNAASAVWVQVA
jgi:hypothetical protein